MVSIVFKPAVTTLFNGTYGSIGRMADLTHSFTVTDGKSTTWGTFKVGDTLTIQGKNENTNQVFSTQEATYLGIHVRTGTGTEAERTYLVFTFIDDEYSETRYLLVGPHPGSTIDLGSQFNGADDITEESYFIPCFLPGTLIATPKGERRVEELAAGDMILSPPPPSRTTSWATGQNISPFP